MIITDLLDYLKAGLNPEDPNQSSEESPEEVYVGMEAPEQLANYVIIDQTGSDRRNHIITTTFAIQSYGASLYDAIMLNEAVKAVMRGFYEKDNIVNVQLQTDYNFTDTETKQYRWQAVYEITHYEEE